MKNPIKTKDGRVLSARRLMKITADEHEALSEYIKDYGALSEIKEATQISTVTIKAGLKRKSFELGQLIKLRKFIATNITSNTQI